MPTPFTYPITFLPTVDLDKTRQFYEHLLKLPVALDQGACVIFRVGKFGYLAFCSQAEHSADIKNPGEVCLTLIVDTQTEVDEWHQYLVDAGIKVKRPPQYTAAYKIYNGFYIDPMGYTIEIQAFDEDAQPTGAESLMKE